MSDHKHVPRGQIVHIPDSLSPLHRSLRNFRGLNRGVPPTFEVKTPHRKPTVQLRNRARKRNRFRPRVPPFWPFGSVAPSTAASPALSARTRSNMSFTRKRKRRRKSTHVIAKQALSRVRKLERKVEVKMFDIIFTTIADVSTTGAVTHLAAVGSGDDTNDRDGLRIAPFFVKIRYHWEGAAASTKDVYRTIIFRDNRQVASTTPAVLDVLVQLSPLSQFNVSNRGRFKILWDNMWTNANDTAILQNFAGVMNIRLVKQMGWSDGSGGNVNMNGLYMLNITNLTVSNLAQFRFTSRMFFNDT